MDRPRLREDLRWSEQTGEQGPAFVVKDPASGRFFRFGALEAFLLRAMDGRRTREEVAGAFEREFGLELEREQLDGFVEQMRAAGFLAGQAQARTVRGSTWFYWRIPLLRPEPLLRAIHPAFRLLVSPPGWALTLLLLAGGTAVLATDRSRYLADLARPPAARALLLAYGLLLLVTLLHELAHALVCRAHGGEVPEIGFLFLYGMPAFYCDVSDAWLFTSRWKRCAVTFAGPYVHGVAWGALLLLWRLLDPSSLAGRGALYCSVAVGAISLFNFNPLIKLDGYYLLSDALDLPNLRPRAFSWIGQSARWLLFGLWEAPFGQPSRREAALYWLYGLLALAFTGWILMLFGTALGGWLVERLGLLGWLLAGLLVTWALARPALGLVAGTLDAMRRLGPLRFLKSRFTLTLLLLAAAGYGAHRLPWELRVGGVCTLEAGKRVRVRLPHTGRLAALLVRHGQLVRAGQPLARLDRRPLLQEQEKLAAQRDQVAAELALLEAGKRPEEIAQARLKQEAAQLDRKLAQARLARLVKLRGQGAGAVSKNDVEEAQREADVARIKVAQTGQELALLQAPPRPQQKARLAARLREIEVGLAALREQLARTVITAPIDGVVIARELETRDGAYLEQGTELCELVQLARMRARIEIDERDILEVRQGARVEIKLHGRPEATLRTTVDTVGPAAQENGGASRVELSCWLPNDERRLKPRMTGYAKVAVRQSTLLRVALRPLFQMLRLEFWW